MERVAEEGLERGRNLEEEEKQSEEGGRVVVKGRGENLGEWTNYLSLSLFHLPPPPPLTPLSHQAVSLSEKHAGLDNH